MYKKSIYFLLVAVMAMIALGIVMLFSTSAYAQDSHGDPVYFVKRQCIWLGVGIVVCICTSLVDYHKLEKNWLIWFVLTAVLLALCFVPHIGMKINGARRWIGVGPIRFQPSDFAKISSVIFLARWLSVHEKDLTQFLKGFAYPLLILCIPLGLIAREIDMGTTALIAGTAIVLMFIAGSGLRFLAPIAIIGICATIFIGTHLKGRSERITAFMHPEQFKEGAGLQQYQALIAFGSGGVEGLGLGMAARNCFICLSPTPISFSP